MGFRRRQAVIAALTANAIRPISGFGSEVPAFFASWLTGELAPHLLGFTIADASTHLGGRRRDSRGLALAAASAVGLGYLVYQARTSAALAEKALTDGIGEDYRTSVDGSAAEVVRWRSLARPFKYPKQGVTVHRDIAFGEHGRANMLDIYAGEDVEPGGKAPVLIQVHGGAWMISKKEEQALPLMYHLAARGWVCVAINYRMSPKHAWPAHIVDVKSAIAWVKEHIDAYGGDPDYVVITGGSAGGHLAALAALTPGDPDYQPGFEAADTSVAAAVPIYGIYDFAGATGLKKSVGLRDSFLSKWVMQTTWEDDPKLFEAASPILRVGEHAPDFLILHGARDTLAPVDQTRIFVERLREQTSASVAYIELPGTQHAFDVFNSVRSAHMVRAIERYLRWHRSTRTSPG